MIDGAAADHDLVVQGRLEGQAPDIDAVVYLTDFSPDDVRPGQLVRGRIVGAKDYDVVVAVS
jgi:hypothetical protein